MAGILDLFNTPAPAPTPAPSATPSASPSPAPAGNPTVPAAGSSPVQLGADGKPVAPSPLDQYGKLWENDPTPANNGAAKPADPAAFLEVAKRMDFSKVLNPETLKKVAAGGDDAMAAFSESMNTIAQTVYAQSAHASTQITQEAVKRAQAEWAKQIPGLIKASTVSSGMREDHPILSHPSSAPIIGALEQQFVRKYPNATAAELKRMTTDYLTQFATALLPAPASSGSGKEASKEDNWEGFFAPQQS